jgi:hypothetical protein
MLAKNGRRIGMRLFSRDDKAMSQKFDALLQKHIDFIALQKIFFVGTATAESRINVSPKGMDSLRVRSPSEVIWLNVTGSGNESSAHVQVDSRMTIMFCAFEGDPLILRLYGRARVTHRGESRWTELFQCFPPLPGARQIFELHVDLVQSSCGMAVPNYSYVEDRELLNTWAAKKDESALQEYWAAKNQESIDGIATNILGKSEMPSA